MLFMVVPWCYKHDFFLWLFSVLAYVIGSESHLSNCRHGREALEKERINEQLNQLRDIPVGKFQSILKSRTSIVFHFIILYPQCARLGYHRDFSEKNSNSLPNVLQIEIEWRFSLILIIWKVKKIFLVLKGQKNGWKV